MKKFIFVLLVMCAVVPGFVLAFGGSGGASGGGTGTTGTTGGTGSNPNVITATITNPLKKGIGKDISSIITAVMKNIVMPLASVLVVLAILYSGFKFVVAQGNPKELEEARKGFMWVLVGSAVLLGAYGISEALQNTVNSIVEMPK